MLQKVCFRKFRSSTSKQGKLEYLYTRRNQLKENADKKHDNEIKEVEKEIADEASILVSIF